MIEVPNRKLEQHHIEWLERNDGKYEVIPDNSYWVCGEQKIQNKIRFVFRNTVFGFNAGGLPEAIEKAMIAYPDS